MTLSVEEVRRIARLARLRLTADEEQTFAPQLAQIIDFFDQLRQCETAPVDEESLSSTLEADDEVRASMPQADFLANAPSVRSSFLLVPQVKVAGDE